MEKIIRQKIDRLEHEDRKLTFNPLINKNSSFMTKKKKKVNVVERLMKKQKVYEKRKRKKKLNSKPQFKP